jgi:CIC family chloride channel protein
MNSQVETLPEHLHLAQLAEIIAKSKYNTFPVINEKGSLTGILSYLDYHDVAFDENLGDLVVVKEIATPKVITISEEDNLFSALERITSKDFSLLPVVAPDDPARMVGVLTRRDIIGAYNKAVLKKGFLF